MTVALVGIACFATLLTLNWIPTHSLLYPGAVITGIWLLEFVVQIFAVGTLRPVSWEALLIFIIGVVAFSMGSVLGYGGHRRRPQQFIAPKEYVSDRLILWALFGALLAGFPLYLEYIRTFTEAPLFSPQFILQARAGFLNEQANVSRAPLVANLAVLAIIGAIVAYAVTEGGRRWRVLVWLLLAMALVYNLLTASKVGVIELVVSLFAIHILLRHRVPVLAVSVGIAAVFVLFGVINVARVEALGVHLSAAQMVKTTWEQFLGYFAASPVGFSIYLDHPHWVTSVWSPWRFFERTANYFGNYFHVPDLNGQYVNVGYEGNVFFYNTYTAFFSYYSEYGIIGVIGFMFGLGTISVWIYRRALSGGVIWVVLYGMVFYGIVMTIFNESLLLALNSILKLVVFTLIFLSFRKLHFRSRPLSAARDAPQAFR